MYRQISDSRFWAPDRIRRWWVRLALGRATAIVALSDFNRREMVTYLGIRDERIHVVPNGVPGDRFGPATTEQRNRARSELGLSAGPVVLCAGALVPEKGVDLAIDAVGALDGVTLLVAGEGPDREELAVRAHTAAPGRVRFVGSLPDLLPAYWASDLLVLASRGGDAMPAAIIEAGLCGVPAVATDIGAISEMIEDGRTGAVVGPDDVTGLQAAVSGLLDCGGSREAAGLAARARCLSHYEIGPVARAWERVLDRVTDAG